MTMDREAVAITRRVAGRSVTYDVPVDSAVSRPEAAAVLCVSLRQVYRLVKARRLPVIQERGEIRIPLASVLEYRDRRSSSMVEVPGEEHQKQSPDSEGGNDDGR